MRDDSSLVVLNTTENGLGQTPDRRHEERLRTYTVSEKLSVMLTGAVVSAVTYCRQPLSKCGVGTIVRDGGLKLLRPMKDSPPTSPTVSVVVSGIS